MTIEERALQAKDDGAIYLLHFDRKLAHSQHYLGFSESGIEARIERHRKGRGAKITAAAVEAGIEFELARTWEGVDRNFERWLKNKKAAPRLCPICSEGAGKSNKDGN